MKRGVKHLLTTLIVCIIFVTGLLVGQHYGQRLTSSQVRILLSSPTAQNDKLTRVLTMIEKEYVDSISRDSLAELAIPAILHKLDPHSVYLPPKQFEEADEPLKGEFDGIGVVFNMATDTVIVLNVIPSGPSRKAGVQGGDRIIKVNDTLIAGQKMSQMSRPGGSTIFISM